MLIATLFCERVSMSDFSRMQSKIALDMNTQNKRISCRVKISFVPHKPQMHSRNTLRNGKLNISLQIRAFMFFLLSERNSEKLSSVMLAVSKCIFLHCLNFYGLNLFSIGTYRKKHERMKEKFSKLCNKSYFFCGNAS